MAEIPLLCLFLCLLWKEKKTEGLPTTRTALYQQIVQCIIDHSGSKSNPPTNMTLKEYDEALRKIGRIAYEALKKDSLLFDLRELTEVKQANEIMSLGLLSTTSASRRKAQNMISFLHKSLQEFAAAWYVAMSLEGNDPAAHQLLDDLHIANYKPKFLCEIVLCTLCHSENMVHFICGLSAKAACEIFKKLCVLKETFGRKEIVYFCDTLDLQNAVAYTDCLAIFEECGYSPDVSPLFVRLLDGSLAVDACEIFEDNIELYEQLFNDGLRNLLIFEYQCNNPQQSCLMFLCQKLGLRLPSAVNNGQCVGTSAMEFMNRLLELSRNNPVTIGLSKIKTNFILKFYEFDGKLNTDHMTLVSEYPQELRTLKVEDDIQTLDRVPFDKLLNVRTLCIEYTELTMEDVRRLISGLCNMKQLRVLTLWRTGLTGHSVQTLCEHLKYVTQLQELSLCQDFTYNKQMGDEGVMNVAQHLCDVPHLRKLDLSRTGMTASGVTSLLAALPHIPHLEELHLSFNPLCDGVVSLAGHLSSVPQLTWLRLCGTEMTDAGVRAVTAALCHVPLLESLDLSMNECVDSDSWIKLADELHHLDKLCYLDLSCCGITGTAAEQSLKNAVPQGCQLRIFELM